jgi:hypothetical protein
MNLRGDFHYRRLPSSIRRSSGKVEVSSSFSRGIHMSRSKWRRVWVAVGCGAALAISVIAAPMVGGAAHDQLPDEILSLSQIKKVRVQFPESLPEDLIKAGMTNERFQTLAKKRLSNAGIELVETGDVPVLLIKAITITDPSIREATALIFFCDVQQRIKLIRLDRELEVPTCTAIAYATARTD